MIHLFITRAALALAGCSLLFVGPACSPIQPPPKLQPLAEIAPKSVEPTAIRTPGNMRPPKYGTALQLDYARQQAGATRPGSEIEISADQLSFGKVAGRN